MRAKSLSGEATRAARAAHVQKLLDDADSKVSKVNADVHLVLMRSKLVEKLVVQAYLQATNQASCLKDMFEEGCRCEVFCAATLQDDADWWDAKVVKVDDDVVWTKYIQHDIVQDADANAIGYGHGQAGPGPWIF